MTWAQAIPVWVTIALAIAGVLFVRRNGGSGAIGDLELANQVLTKSNTDLKARVHELELEVQSLKARTDVSLAILPVLEALKLHEQRASERSEKHLHVLGMIADRLGADAEAA